MAFGIEKINWDKIKSFLGNALFGAIFISFVGFSWLVFGEYCKSEGNSNV